MDRRQGVVSLLVMLIAAACAPDATAPITAPPPPPPPPPPPFLLTGLKEIVHDHLPAPYYHFEYDSTGLLKFASFASDARRYDIVYAAGRISEMDNNILVNHDRLVYVYDDSGRVALVREVDQGGVVFEVVVLTYDGQKLIGLERDRRVTGGFVLDKTITLSYYPDGNLRELAEHRPAIAGFQDEQRYADLYERYDTENNANGFELLHDDFFDHLVLLPIQLQKNNPQRVTRSGDGPNFVVEYTYTYDTSNRPLTRSGLVTLTNGTDVGRQIQVSSAFSYY